jgi:dihydrolipoamide dehydrogenase
LGAEVTVVEYLGAIGGPGMDADMAKTMQKILQKQGIKFKLGTKVTGGEVSDSSVGINIEAAKGGKAEKVNRSACGCIS